MFEVNWGIEERERISATVLPKFNKNRREKEKKVERERRGISATLLPKFLRPNSCPSCVLCAKKKKLRQCHCRNRKKKYIFLVIVAMSLSKMGGKKKFVAEIWEEILKKVLRSQYFYNTFTINHRWLVIISSNLILILRLLF